MNGWSAYWGIWFGLFMLAFLVPEIYALTTGHSENTLSANVWRLEQFLPGQHPAAWTASHVLIGGCLTVLLGWLIVHLVWGLWR
jgi:hypothetical protein